MSIEKVGSARKDGYLCDKATRGFKRQNHHASIVHLGPMAAIRSATPPPVVEYDAWLAERAPDCRNGVRSRGFNMTGAKLRRMVVMRRQGCTGQDIGLALGITAIAANGWLRKLPEGLTA